jgi:hypothetical protein
VLDRFKKQAASWSRRVLFVDVIFAVSISAANHPPAFSKKLWSGGRAGGRAGGKGWLKSVVVRRGGRLRRPAAAAFRLPPLFFSLACNLLAFFFSGQSFGRCAPLAQLRGRRAEKNERRVCLLVGCSLFQRKRQNKKNLKFKCTNSRSLAEAERSFSLL